MAGLSLVTPPSIEPVTLAEANLFAKIDVNTDDALVTDLIAGARRAVEEYLNRSLITQVWDYFLDAFPSNDVPLCLPRGPVQTVGSVKYTPTGASTATVSASDYYVDTSVDKRGRVRDARIMPVVGKYWPGDLLRIMNGVEVRYTSGYGAAAANVPENIREGIKALVNYWYYNRQAIGTIPDPIGATLMGATSVFAYA